MKAASTLPRRSTTPRNASARQPFAPRPVQWTHTVTSGEALGAIPVRGLRLIPFPMACERVDLGLSCGREWATAGTTVSSSEMPRRAVEDRSRASRIHLRGVPR